MAAQPRTPAPEVPRTAALVLARDHAKRIAATVRAALSIPGVDLVLVLCRAAEEKHQPFRQQRLGALMDRSFLRRLIELRVGVNIFHICDFAPERRFEAINRGQDRFVLTY